MTKKKILGCLRVLPVEYHWSRPVVLKYIFPVAAVAVTVGLRWPLCINHTKKAVKLKYTFKLYQYFSYLGISAF
jgi:hypothetical protein